ncbi:MAG: hypothetical protein IIC64_11725 [SAR324 cluster bacterium]|nr:hypothetical protein [SAR324 cluster bacterium]
MNLEAAHPKAYFNTRFGSVQISRGGKGFHPLKPRQTFEKVQAKLSMKNPSGPEKTMADPIKKFDSTFSDFLVDARAGVRGRRPQGR